MCTRVLSGVTWRPFDIRFESICLKRKNKIKNSYFTRVFVYAVSKGLKKKTRLLQIEMIFLYTVIFQARPLPFIQKGILIYSNIFIFFIFYLYPDHIAVMKRYRYTDSEDVPRAVTSVLKSLTPPGTSRDVFGKKGRAMDQVCQTQGRVMWGYGRINNCK